MYLYFLSSPISDALKEHPYFTLQNDEDTRYVIELDAMVDNDPAIPAYEAIDASGSLSGSKFIVMNNIPVTDDGREAFEARFMNRARKVEDEPGFAGIRVLRPLNSDTYVILTAWDSKASFEAWQQSQAFAHAHQKRDSQEGLKAQAPSIFARPSFITTYTVE
ncbi:antibiotic biosynthesis monooxygenase family protein [Paenibacillus shunpengii]|uniref:Antibiotic biosynthesis monooxygenase family protein n=1 Tax=Paenibacillus shunpengii TaxID=2054424 RepID=A0ABW5SUI0_9BACL|nr:antibiotic biosynthesis monooxygenase [Paenibacillus sp. PDC88]SDW88228.1 Heme-degrading monooxygenase HmoA [Paenibacillus sp. PDC88]